MREYRLLEDVSLGKETVLGNSGQMKELALGLGG